MKKVLSLLILSLVTSISCSNVSEEIHQADKIREVAVFHAQRVANAFVTSSNLTAEDLIELVDQLFLTSKETENSVETNKEIPNSPSFSPLKITASTKDLFFYLAYAQAVLETFSDKPVEGDFAIECFRNHLKRDPRLATRRAHSFTPIMF